MIDGGPITCWFVGHIFCLRVKWVLRVWMFWRLGPAHVPNARRSILPLMARLQVPRQAYEEDVKMSYSISPVSLSTRLLSKPSKAKRKIPKIPFKVGLLGRSVGCVRVVLLEAGRSM